MLNKPRLLTPGPTPLPEQVRLALAQDMIHHRKAAFKDIMLRVQGKLQTLFGTEQTVLPLSCSGTGAMTAAVHSLFAPGEKVLVVNGGKFGERWQHIAAARGLECVQLDVPWGHAVEPAAVERALEADPRIRGVLMQLSDRIMVMCGGKVSGIVDPRNVTKEDIGLMMIHAEGAQPSGGDAGNKDKEVTA